MKLYLIPFIGILMATNSFNQASEVETEQVPDFSSQIKAVCAPAIEDLRNEIAILAHKEPGCTLRNYLYSSIETLHIKDNGKVDIYMLHIRVNHNEKYFDGTTKKSMVLYFRRPIGSPKKDIDIDPSDARINNLNKYHIYFVPLVAYCMNEYYKLPKGEGKKIIKWEKEACIECEIVRDSSEIVSPGFTCRMEISNDVYKGLRKYDKNYSAGAQK